MPEGTAVDRTYKALLKEGKSEESAARIAQAQTGEALATGKPPKHKEENCSLENSADDISSVIAQYNATGRYAKHHPIRKTISVDGREMSEEKGIMKMKGVVGRVKSDTSNSFQNGRTRALNHIMNRAANVGVKLENAGHDFSKGWGSNYESREYMQGWKDGKGDDVKFQQSPYPAGIAKKDWERGWQDGYKAKHNQPNTSRMG